MSVCCFFCSFYNQLTILKSNVHYLAIYIYLFLPHIDLLVNKCLVLVCNCLLGFIRGLVLPQVTTQPNCLEISWLCKKGEFHFPLPNFPASLEFGTLHRSRVLTSRAPSSSSSSYTLWFSYLRTRLRTANKPESNSQIWWNNRCVLTSTALYCLHNTLDKGCHNISTPSWLQLN